MERHPFFSRRHPIARGDFPRSEAFDDAFHKVDTIRRAGCFRDVCLRSDRATGPRFGYGQFFINDSGFNIARERDYAGHTGVSVARFRR